MAHCPRNRVLAGGIMRYGRSKMYARKAVYKKKKITEKPKKESRKHYEVKDIKGENNGGKRVVLLKKTSRYYPTEDFPRKIRTRKHPTPPKLRSSITPGTVLILLAGKHKGKRVVFLKRLDSGLLLVTGPFQVNGVPMRRVCQAYVIATQTKVDLTDVDFPKNINDDYFRRPQSKKKKGGSIFADSSEATSLPEERKADQKTVDSLVVPKIKAVPSLRSYLASRFFLHKKQYPHKMVF